MLDFLHTYYPSSVLVKLGPLTIHWYGLLIVLGILLGLFLTLRLSKRYGFTADNVYDLAFYLIISSVIGARLYMIVLFPALYFRNPLEILKIWQGGLAIHGAIIGGILALFFYCKRYKQSFWLWADIIVVALAMGQAIGRWGNYFNQELYGLPTGLPWGIFIDPANRVAGYENFEFFHPVFLYESILNLILFFILLSLHRLRIKSDKQLTINNQQSTKRNITRYGLRVTGYVTPGSIALVYLISYSAIRIAMEQFRIDAAPMIFGIRFPVLVSAGVIIIAGFFLFRRILQFGLDRKIPL